MHGWASLITLTDKCKSFDLTFFITSLNTILIQSLTTPCNCDHCPFIHDLLTSGQGHLTWDLWWHLVTAWAACQHLSHLWSYNASLFLNVSCNLFNPKIIVWRMWLISKLNCTLKHNVATNNPFPPLALANTTQIPV